MTRLRNRIRHDTARTMRWCNCCRKQFPTANAPKPNQRLICRKCHDCAMPCGS